MFNVFSCFKDTEKKENINNLTPRQIQLHNKIQLPKCDQYPLPPGVSRNQINDPTEEKRLLLEAFRDFVLELNKGMILSQLSSNRECSDIHCQLYKNLDILKFDQNNGRIVEFPLRNIIKLYEISKSSVDLRWHTSREDAFHDRIQQSDKQTEHVVVVEFTKRKLAFVFRDPILADKFLITLQLLYLLNEEKK
eukprot:GHVL01025933.1.p1 GENE.GHVL01025933.1~~GHVL01025933.1.p1  ORF type:complete len:203 (+),score=46.21 GHVL01025933.1:33-611(+)